MGPFHESMGEYKEQLQKGAIQKAYRGLMDYIMDLRTYFEKKYPDHYVSGSIYFGYMDMTYFSFIPKLLKERNLKVAIVFIHETCRFEAWLAGINKQVQTKYWNLFRESEWDKYHLASSPKSSDSILEYVLVSDPDFSELDTLTNQIESETLKFIKDVEDFLSDQ